MKPNTISLRRRQLLIAGLAGAATPGALFAAQCNVAAAGQPQLAEIFTKGTEETLVVSGRIVAGDCKPLSGALVEVWYTDPRTAVATNTDADGRFVLTTIVPASGDSRSFKIAVSTPGKRTRTAQRHFTREPGAANDALVQVHRDEAGLWRTTLGLTFV